MSTQGDSAVALVKEHGKHKSKSDKKRRLEESAADTVQTKTKRQKHAQDVNHNDDNDNDDEVKKSKKQDKKENKDKKNKRGDSPEPSLTASGSKKDQELELQQNGTAQDANAELPDASQVTEASESTDKKSKSRKREKKLKDATTESALEPVTEGEGNVHEDEYDRMEVDESSASADEARESGDASAEPVTAGQVPITPEDKSLGVDLLGSCDRSSFYSTRISLYLPIPAITLPRHAISSLLSRHLAPLLLTYFPPVKGIVLAFRDPVISANAGAGLNHPLKPPTEGGNRTQHDAAHIKQVLALASDQQGVAWVWLTVTFLVFNPQRGDQLYGVNNVASEGFVGLVSYNYFQISIGAKRIPGPWKWRGPETSQVRKQKRRTKGKMDEDGRWTQSSPVPADPPQSSVGDERSRTELENETGFFLESGAKVDSVIKFKVVDTDMVAGSHRGEWALHVDGTLLDDEAEQLVREGEIQSWERQHLRQGTPRLELSGALAVSREGSTIGAF